MGKDTDDDDLEAVTGHVEEGKKPAQNRLQEVTDTLEFSGKNDGEIYKGTDDD